MTSENSTNNNGKLIIIGIGIVLLIIVCYFVLTPVGSLRFALIKRGYFLNAFKSGLTSNRNYDETLGDKLVYTIDCSSVGSEGSADDLQNYIIEKNFIFYDASFYGWTEQ